MTFHIPKLCILDKVDDFVEITNEVLSPIFSSIFSKKHIVVLAV